MCWLDENSGDGVVLVYGLSIDEVQQVMDFCAEHGLGNAAGTAPVERTNQQIENFIHGEW